MRPFLGISRQEWRFLAVFLASFFALFFLLISIDLSGLTDAITSLEAGLLHALGIPVTVSGSFMVFGNGVVRVIAECTGLVMVILLFSLLIATPMPSRRRFKAFVLFAPLLLLFNLIRLAVTLVAFFRFASSFEAVHVVLWVVDSAVVLGVWYYTYTSNW